MASSTRTVIAISVALGVVVGITCGVLIGYFSAAPRSSSETQAPAQQPACDDNADSCNDYEAEDDSISRALIDAVNADQIRDYLRTLTSKPHLAGTATDQDTATFVHDEWVKNGLDTVTLASYDVLLSYPDETAPNKIQIFSESTGEVVYQRIPGEEKLSDSDDDWTNVVQPFNAYSGSGIVEGDLMYINYGRERDFDRLIDYGHDLKDKILLARYGSTSRGNKAYRAEKAGAAGLIIYSDPENYGPPPEEEFSNVYPDSAWLPDSGVQRGHLNPIDARGDPLTPGYPSTSSAYRPNASSLELPTIPVQPISYGLAIQLLANMTGDKVINSWIGGLDVEYRYGPGFIDSTLKIRLEVNNKNERKTISNVVGVINGKSEPDRYVVLGNHRDAWVYGAVDAGTGQAPLMEVARVFGDLVKNKGWRPRRSVVFCSWSGHEHSQIGATEWVEEFSQLLEKRAIAYINVDSGVYGNYYPRIKASPILYHVLYEASKRVPAADDESRTIYDIWIERRTNSDGSPRIDDLDSADYRAFFMRYGIPSADLRYRQDSSTTYGISSLSTYHSAYDTFDQVDKFIDPGFSAHKALARYWGEVARDLADSVILPFDCNYYAAEIGAAVEELRQNLEDHAEDMLQYGITLDALDSAVNNFTTAAKEFQEKARLSVNSSSPLAVREVNDRLMYLERAFIDPLGLPGRKFTRHLIYAPGTVSFDSSSTLPGPAEALYKIEEEEEEAANSADNWIGFEEQLSVLTFAIQLAAKTLVDQPL